MMGKAFPTQNPKAIKDLWKTHTETHKYIHNVDIQQWQMTNQGKITATHNTQVNLPTI